MDSRTKLQSRDRGAASRSSSASDMEVLCTPGTQDQSKTGFYTPIIVPDMEFSHMSPTRTVGLDVLLAKNEARLSRDPVGREQLEAAWKADRCYRTNGSYSGSECGPEGIRGNNVIVIHALQANHREQFVKPSTFYFSSAVL